MDSGAEHPVHYSVIIKLILTSDGCRPQRVNSIYHRDNTMRQVCRPDPAVGTKIILSAQMSVLDFQITF